MQEINHRQDFTLWERFYYKDEKGDLQDFGFPPYDFKIFYWTDSRAKAYVASCRYEEGEPVCINCRKIGDKLLVIFDRHRLAPGELKAEMVMDVPSDLYPDGYRNDPLLLNTGIRLIHGPTPIPTRAESMAILPYIKGRDGKDFTYEDLTDEQKEELAGKVVEGMGDMIEEAVGKAVGDDILDNVPTATDNDIEQAWAE